MQRYPPSDAGDPDVDAVINTTGNKLRVKWGLHFDQFLFDFFHS